MSSNHEILNQTFAYPSSRCADLSLDKLTFRHTGDEKPGDHGPQVSVQNLMAILPIFVEMFQSGPNYKSHSVLCQSREELQGVATLPESCNSEQEKTVWMHG